MAQRFVQRVIRLAPSALGHGPAAVDAITDPTGHRFVQSAVVGVAGVLHGGLYLATGLDAFLWVAITCLVYLIVGVPIIIRLADVSASVASWFDLATMIGFALIIGDPITLIAWFPLLVITNLIYVDTITGVRNGIAMTFVALGFYWVMVNVSDRLFDFETARLYLLANMGLWVCSIVVYAVAIGGSVTRHLAEVSAAMAQRDDAEARARAEAARLGVVLEEAPVGLLLQGPDERFEYANPPALEILGVSLEQLLEGGAASAVDAATRDRIEREIAQARDEDKPFLIEHDTVAGRIVELRGRRVDLGGLTTTVTALRDLTPERHARRHIARLRMLVENSQTQMVVWDQQGRVVLANRVFRDLWAVDGQKLEGSRIDEVVGDQFQPLVEMERSEGESTMEFEIVVPDGSHRLAAVSLLDFQDPYDDEWLRSISMRDLTEVAVARRQLEELVVTKDRFIASVSHELRTPLTVVVGLASELADHPERFSPTEVSELAALIASQSNEVTSIVEDLLTIARADSDVLSVRPEAMSLTAVVNSVLTVLPPELVGRVMFEGGESDPVWADPIRVRQIVRNLLTNAERHGGPLIEIEVQSGAVVVRDDGPPIPEADRARIFEAYERINPTTGTTDSVGLGLTVCQRLSTLMGGDVTYHHDGRYSTFTLELPLAETLASGAPAR